jgi:hypothetical protein
VTLGLVARRLLKEVVPRDAIHATRPIAHAVPLLTPTLQQLMLIIDRMQARDASRSEVPHNYGQHISLTSGVAGTLQPFSNHRKECVL